MTVRDIRHHLASTLGVEVSAATISTITDAVCEAVLEWQHRPLEAFYPVIYLDAIVVKVRDGQVRNTPFNVVMGVTTAGERDILGIWAGDGGEDGRLCVRDRVHVEVEVHLRRDRAAWPGGRAEVGDGLAGERERADARTGATPGF